MGRKRKTPNYDIRIPNQPEWSYYFGTNKNKHAVDMSTAPQDELQKVKRFEKRNILKPKKLK